MQVTAVRFRRGVNGDGKVRATCSVEIGGDFVVHDVRVVDGSSGLFVAMPSRRLPSGDFLDVAHPVTAAARETIQASVLAAYQMWESEGR